ncbi:CADH5 protein, partial [Amia calva]|nr:CADH5 protein [Amia calva]
MDINDNVPTFTHSQYNGSVPERSNGGTSVLKVTATDLDDPTTEYGKVVYDLLEGKESFNINTETGLITTKTLHDYTINLDREKKDTYKLIVQAKDTPSFKTGGTSTVTVIVTLEDINDNLATFTQGNYNFDVKESESIGFIIGRMKTEDKDELQNKNPIFTIKNPDDGSIFNVKQDFQKFGVITLLKALDFETIQKYEFDVEIDEATSMPADNEKELKNSKAHVTIKVLDVNEPPVFKQPSYNFTIEENVNIGTSIGSVSAHDPDKAKNTIRYSINEDSPLRIDPTSGTLYTAKELDREMNHLYAIPVTAAETDHEGLKSQVIVNLKVSDVNDNDPELGEPYSVFVCENDGPGTVIFSLYSDKDEITPGSKASFALASPNANFSLVDNHDGSANISVKQGGFTFEDTKEYIINIVISDNGQPSRSSTILLPISVCKCEENRINYHCMKPYAQTGVSVHAVTAILLCILTILVIVILIVMRKRYRKDTLATLGKSSGEIHEQLVTYDEEGGGEMDTNGYDVTVLNSARNNSIMPGPCLYATVQKPAGKADMGIMIEVKKDEADHDRDAIPYDTLHIYGYEGPESLAGSLSSLETSSSDSNLDYDFLNDWGPRFKTLAELYGVDASEDDYEY